MLEPLLAGAIEKPEELEAMPEDFQVAMERLASIKSGPRFCSSLSGLNVLSSDNARQCCFMTNLQAALTLSFQGPRLNQRTWQLVDESDHNVHYTLLQAKI